MLAAGICRAYGVPEPEHIRDRSIIRRPRDPVVHQEIPQILQSHYSPSPLVHIRLLRRLLRFPKYVFLIRDIRAALVSQYEKKSHLPAFQLSFFDYLRGRWIRGNPIPRDLWFRTRLLNAWSRDTGRLAKK